MGSQHHHHSLLNLTGVQGPSHKTVIWILTFHAEESRFNPQRHLQVGLGQDHYLKLWKSTANLDGPTVWLNKMWFLIGHVQLGGRKQILRACYGLTQNWPSKETDWSSLFKKWTAQQQPTDKECPAACNCPLLLLSLPTTHPAALTSTQFFSCMSTWGSGTVTTHLFLQCCCCEQSRWWCYREN